MQFGECPPPHPPYIECDWRNINLWTKRLAQLLRTISGLRGGNVSLDFSPLLHGLFHFLLSLILDQTKGSGKEVKRYRLKLWHARTEAHHFSQIESRGKNFFKFIIIRCDLHGSKPRRKALLAARFLPIEYSKRMNWEGEEEERSFPWKRHNSPKAWYAELPGAEVRIHATSFKVKSMQYLLNWHQPGVVT